jgi:hypothetical protein
MHNLGRGAVALGWLGLAFACRSPAAAGEAAVAQGRRQAVVDHAVQPAGGACRGCREAHCHTCRPGLHGHHGACRDGKCHPYCPVRPQEFGFYGTQWRRWPGQGVVPVSNIQDATPEKPPKSAVPGAAEESRRMRPDELPVPETDAGSVPADRPAIPETIPEPETRPETRPGDLPDAAGKAGDEPPAAPNPPAGAPPVGKPTADEDLFDESATGPVPRRFLAGRARRALAATPEPAEVRPATLAYPPSIESLPRSVDRDPLRVPRVSFDPAAEAARLRR